ncbi:kunitz-type serine protease inhibitor 2-like [Anoplophora glabripennis]|uniref:kunitz-type serine protease inhibitor 2-like n=1 Tax=Anoplophora glabripennis TaxID=217634 RepID=UPI0008757168|nr:kunitz-type serine protease inhibitor 2-like [Anoplophora glabripennis]
MYTISRYVASSLFILVLHLISASCFTVDDCFKDVQEGLRVCRAYIPVFKWNMELQECDIAIYGGCYPTSNNFKTIEECQLVTESVCKKLRYS